MLLAAIDWQTRSHRRRLDRKDVPATTNGSPSQRSARSPNLTKIQPCLTPRRRRRSRTATNQSRPPPVCRSHDCAGHCTITKPSTIQVADIVTAGEFTRRFYRLQGVTAERAVTHMLLPRQLRDDLTSLDQHGGRQPRLKARDTMS
jgi:hypothetical protein